MRLLHLDLRDYERENISNFLMWLIDIGDGNSGTPDESNTDDSSWVHIADELCIPNNESATSKLIRFIYEEQTLQQPSARELQHMVIVCPKNETADIINNQVLSMVKHESRTYNSFDEAAPCENDV
ncbi:DNA helicase [Tanacetum coccineum]